jgi:hypoxanthine phosphoribosyltransferase
MRAMDMPCNVDFMAVSSYGASSETTGKPRIIKDLSQNIAGRDVIVVEDILDSGVTLSFISELFVSRSPRSVRLCTLLDKPSRRTVDVKADYSGFEIPDAFVVGYGLDYADRYRNLPYIGVLKPEIYAPSK